MVQKPQGKERGEKKGSLLPTHNMFVIPGKESEQSAERPSWCSGGMSAGEAEGRPPTGPGCPSTTS